ncbi:MAG: hypothetical protein JWQ69_4221, partial [Pseudomonas sp.]|nr:hypothetical protein [Pseudomonas sp.]
QKNCIVPVGAAEGCDKVGTAFSVLKSATGSRSIAAFGSSYRGLCQAGLLALTLL